MFDVCKCVTIGYCQPISFQNIYMYDIRWIENSELNLTTMSDNVYNTVRGREGDRLHKETKTENSILR